MNNISNFGRQFIFENSYRLPHDHFKISSGLLADPSKIFEDWEDFNPKNLVEYFDKGYEILRGRLEEFKALKRPLTETEDQELKFMLDALIHAKNSLYEQN